MTRSKRKPRLKLYLLKQQKVHGHPPCGGFIDHGYYDSCIVIATSKNDAALMSPNDAIGMRELLVKHMWAPPDSVALLGNYSGPLHYPCVIISSFNSP